MVSGHLPGESRAHQIQIPCGVFFVLTPLFVAVRIWARVKVRSWAGLGWDDWTILASCVCVVLHRDTSNPRTQLIAGVLVANAKRGKKVFAAIVSILMMVACEYGFGQHIANLSRPNKLMTLKVASVTALYRRACIANSQLGRSSMSHRHSTSSPST